MEPEENRQQLPRQSKPQSPCRAMQRAYGKVPWSGDVVWNVSVEATPPLPGSGPPERNLCPWQPPAPHGSPTGDFEFNSIIPNRVLQSPLGLGQWQPWPEFSPAFSTVRLPQLVVSIGQLSPQTSPCPPPPPPSNTPPSKLEEP